MSLNLLNPFMKFASGGDNPVFYRLLARASGTGTSITTSSFDASNAMMVLMYTHAGSSAETACYQFNSVTSGSKYCNRFSTNGGSDNTSQTDRDRILNGSGFANADGFAVGYVGNIADVEKLVISFSCENGGTGANTPNRREIVGKFVETSNAITTATLFGQDGNGWGASSEIVVLGTAGGDDTAWENLATVSGDGSSDTLDSGTITAKKYLMVEFYGDVGTGGTMDNMGMRMNSDSTNNYSYRSSVDGGSEGTTSDNDYMRFGGGSATGHTLFTRAFIVNDSSYEKLAITQSSRIRNAGNATAPTSFEMYGKWRNTSDSITSIQIKNDEDNWTSSSKLAVWGFN